MALALESVFAFCYLFRVIIFLYTRHRKIDTRQWHNDFLVALFWMGWHSGNHLNHTAFQSH